MFYVSPDDVAKYIPVFRSLSAWWQIVIVVAVTAILFALAGWRVALAFYGERLKTQGVIIDNYRAQGLSPDEIANQKRRLSEVQAELTDFKSMFWRKLKDDEKTALRERVALIGQYSFRIVSAHDADCHDLAGDLTRVIESAGWKRVFASQSVEEYDLDDWDLKQTSGIRVLGKYPVDNAPGPKLADALKPLIKLGPSFAASLRDGDTADVVLFIGPKGHRSLLPEK
jgi:hypothetical protein